MRYFAVAAAAFALTYFLDPENGRWRRQALRAWLSEGARRFREPTAQMPEEAPAATVGNGRPPVAEERPAAAEAPVREREPVAVSVAAAPEPEEVPHPVAVAEPPVAETVLPPPLPPEVLETPPREVPVEEPVAEEPRRPSRTRRSWLIGGAVLLAAGLAAAGLAAWSFDAFDSDEEAPTASARALSALADRQARAISIMAQPGATRIPVVGAEERLLLIVGMEGDAVLLVSRLEEAPAGRTYEIWVIEGETPRPAGLFRGGRDIIVPLTRPVPKGAIVALTLEPAGGSRRPTSTPIYTVKRS
jgi:Anti-sigma-K factor rskA